MSFGRDFEWADHIETAVEILETCRTAADAADALSDQLQRDVSRKGLLSAMARAYRKGLIDRPAAEIIGSRYGAAPTKHTPTPSFDLTPEQENPELLKVVRAVQSGIVTWDGLADHLDLSPKRTKDIVDATIKAGYAIHINGSGKLTFELPKQTVTAVPNVPVDGKGWTLVGVMSDMHVGSKHCMKEEMIRFIERAYSEGVRQILIPGDLCEGNLRHHGFQYEVERPDFDGQVELLLKLLPELPGLKYYFSTGNHEVNSWFKTIGMRPDKAIMNRAIVEGRDDLVAVGALKGDQSSAKILLNPGDPETEIKVELSHTADKKAYAVSYAIQKFVESIRPGAKPHVLLKGHLHCHSFFDLRGVVCVQTGCFKDQGTWEQQKNMQPQIGGVIMWLKHAGTYFEVKHHWMAVRPAPVVWMPVANPE